MFTQSNIMFVIGLIGVAYTVFSAIVGPQKKSEANDLLIDQKANFLADLYDKKFSEIQSTITTLTTQNQNHLHTIDSKLDKTIDSMNLLAIQVARLGVVVEERIPNKHI